MIESGHTREAVLQYEIVYMYAFASKRVESIAKNQPDIPQESPGWDQPTKPGIRRKVKRMTSSEMLAAVRAGK